MSDLLNSASLVMIPSGYKEDVVYSQIPTNGNGDLSFTRASDGTRINSAGLVEVTPWNLIQQSETFDNAYWQKANLTVSANATTAPNGTATADKIISSAVNDEHLIYYFESTYLNQVVTLSAYVKKADYRYAIIRSYTNGNYQISVFDLDNGVVEGQVLGASTIESVGNGWYRISTTFTTPAGTFGVQYGFSATPTYSYLGNGTSGNFLWGAQLNIGSTAKPYFPTTDRLNVPRLTYQNGGGGCPSLLLEKQSTNLMYPSEDFTNINYSAANCTITANDTTSPDGTQNADKLTTTSTSLENEVRFSSFSILGNVGSSYTTSVYAKKGTANFLRIRNLFVQNGGTDGNAWFNLNTGTVGTVQSSQTASMQNMGNGWYRCILTGVVGTVNTYDLIDFGFTNADNTNFPSSSVNGYIWGAQLE